MNPRMKNLVLWIVIGLFMILLFNLFTVPPRTDEADLIFSDFMTTARKLPELAIDLSSM